MVGVKAAWSHMTTGLKPRAIWMSSDKIGSDSDEDSGADKTEKEDCNYEHDTLASKEEEDIKETGAAEVSGELGPV